MIGSVGRLCRKELSGLVMHLLVTMAVLTLFRAGVWFWPGDMSGTDRIIIGVVVPLCLLPAWGVLRGAGIVVAEWNRSTSHLLYSLPVPRMAVVSAEGLAVVAELATYALLLVLSLVFTWALIAEGLRPAMEVGFPQTWLAATLLVIAAMYSVLVAAVSFGLLLGVSSHLAGRGLTVPVGLAVASVLLWSVVRLNSFLLSVLPRPGALRIPFWQQERGLIRVMEMELVPAPILAVVLLTAAVLGLTAWLLERADVN